MKWKVLWPPIVAASLALGIPPTGAAPRLALDEDAEAPGAPRPGGAAAAPGATPATPAAPPSAGAGATAAASFDAAALVPFFTEGPLAQAVAKLRGGDAQGAAALIGQAQGVGGGPPTDLRVRFLLAVAQLKTAQAMAPGPERIALGKRAAEHFDALAAAYPLLASYHALYAGRAYLVAEQPRPALERAQRVPSDSVLDCDARSLRGDSLRAEAQGAATAAGAGKPGRGEKPEKPDKKTTALREQAAAAYRAYLASCPTAPRGARWQAQLRLAELLDQLKRPAEALLLWRRLYIEAPTELYGTLAQRRFEQPQTKAAPFTPAELIERAMVLFEEMRNPESEAAFRRILEEPDLDEAQRCVARYHLAQSVFKQRQRPRAAPLYDESVTACGPAAAKNDDLHMKAIYQAARCHASAGELQQAADLFAQAEAAHPGHSYADDSRLRQAEMYLDLADKLAKEGPKVACKADACPDYEAKMTALLADLPERYPDGDKRAEALWRLAFRAYRKQDLLGSQKWLEEALRRTPREVGWDQEGRTLYWLGRVAEQRGERGPALANYRRAAQEYPLSFYTLLSLNRLREGFTPEYAKLVAELLGPVPSAAEDAVPMAFRPRALFGQPGFLRGVELLRLGLGGEARREFHAVGITVPESKSFRVTGVGRPKTEEIDEKEELLWLASVLYDRAGAWHLSHFIPRHVLIDWQRRYPIGTARKQWLLAYPRGYYELLSQAAANNGHPEALQIAIVREESAFDPLTESFANAIGLTQMIPPTAKRFSEGLPYDREALRDPRINVAIGSRFLGFLWRTMGGNPALSISGYNAGEGAVWRWLRNYTDLKEIDAFIEAIPYDETRGYTKRVLSSFLVYAWLYPTAPPPAAAATPSSPPPPATAPAAAPSPPATAPAPAPPAVAPPPAVPPVTPVPASPHDARVPRLVFPLPPPPKK